MAYGEIKVDTITFTDGGIDKSVSISGLVQNPTFSGNITVTGTISGNTLQGQTVSGVTATGATAAFTTGTFISLTGTTTQGTTATYTTGSFTSLTGTTTTGTTAAFASGVFTTKISGETITGNAAAFTTVTGGVATITSGVFASGIAAAPSVSVGTTNNGLYSPGTNQVALSTNGTGRLFVDASGIIGVKRTTQGGVGAFEQIQIGGNAAAGALTTFYGQNNGSAGGIISNAYYDASNNIVYSQTSANVGISNLYLYDGTLVFSNATAGVGGATASLSERLRITSAGLVGIGTSSPGFKLDVNGEIAFSPNTAGKNTFYFTTNASNDASLFLKSDTTNKVNIQANGTSYFNGGNVGIGTSAPAGQLDVSDGTVANTQSPKVYLCSENAADRVACEIRQGRYNKDALVVSSNQSLSANLFNAIENGTSRFVITGAGLVGIGTQSPSLTGSNRTAVTINAPTGQLSILEFGVNNALTGYLYSNASQTTLNSQNTPITFDIQGERARIDSSGRVGIGTSAPGQNITVQSSASGTAPTFKLQNPIDSNSSQGAANNLSAGQLLFGATGSYPLTAKIESVYNADASFGRSAKLIFSGANGSGTLTERLTIDESGRVGIGTTSPSSLLHLADAGDITVGTTTGTKIGTATTQKLGFYNATPVVQPAAVADATDAATVITQLNDLLAKLRTLGIIAT